MEPTGNMDGGRLAKDNFIRANFSLCDVADEEVHFSRDIVASGYLNRPGCAQATGSHHHQGPTTTTTTTAVRQSADFTNINLGGHHAGPPPLATADQVKSSKLLHCIGSKLRRGSNYLAAPKLVGQYLLGITIQSWSEFLNTSRLMRAPGNTQQLTRRLLANLNYFQGNYMCVSLVLVIYCILTSPLLLVAIIAYLIALYLVTVRSATGRHLRIAGYRPNLQQQYSFITLISLPLLWVAGAPSAVFWVIGASFVVVGLHASMYSAELTVAELTEYHAAPQQSRAAAAAATSTHTTTVQYYNHYPSTTTQQYMPISSPPFPPKASEANTGSGSYSSSLTQWITFGSANGATRHKVAPASPRGRRDSGPSTRVPDVTIISQDYAGLGRVYEV